MEPPNGTPPPSPSPPPPPRPSATPLPPLREDCWTEGSTFALIEAWGDRYRALDRGNFSQQDWQDVADSVNSRPGAPSSGKPRRTGVQCKNRIDTLKKKFKLEKARVSDPRDGPGGGYLSPWPFFAGLDALIGSNFPPRKPSRSPTPPPASRSRPKRGASQPARSMLPAVTVPVRPRSHNRTKRAPARSPAGGSFFRPAFSAADEEVAEGEGSERSSSRTKLRSGKGSVERRERGYAELAEAIERLGQIYERVERKKAREMIELEKQRMQFAKDLEQQRMRWFLETQIHLQKIKKLKQTPIDESYL
ncbi:trihelix transcription factor ASIL2-like [Rhodamnia argentea]|uniref:Trihelix transcription factor ASIL2-like n=1 Tax=Rhodamnia argentea TaxID=178133 RepID=A0A8B8N737_9MYRT|nr:trihelix transcription factor ASIL2-like [Rhodamnia argentea]